VQGAAILSLPKSAPDQKKSSGFSNVIAFDELMAAQANKRAPAAFIEHFAWDH
jgi:hypothetical protein